jgi:Fic family protein
VGPVWGGDVDTAELRANLGRLAADIADHAQSGAIPDVYTPRAWHERTFENVPVPSDAYRGGYRGESHPHLVDYANAVGGVLGVLPNQVAGELRRFFTWLRTEIRRLDGRIERFERDFGQEVPEHHWLDFDADLIKVAARAHGEWVRIHPFVNGNGRTARMWVLWLTSRYDLDPLLPLRPRPPIPYDDAGHASMWAGDHGPMESYLLAEYARQAASGAT